MGNHVIIVSILKLYLSSHLINLDLKWYREVPARGARMGETIKAYRISSEKPEGTNIWET
jgi:hypothetical protein